MNNIKISVLVSIYNHDVKYVRKCLESLENQTFKDLEIILLDNGAIQEAKDLIEEFLPKDSRFKVIHIKENKGYGHALNLGLKEAKGDYIGIVESDDFTSPDMYQKLYNQIRKFDADVCIGGFYVHYSDNNDDPNNPHTRDIFKNSDDNKLFSILDYPYLYTCHQSIWAKLYKTEILKTFGFSESGCYIDAQFITELYSRTNKIIALKDHIYYYRADNTNASNSNAKRDKSLMRILDDWTECKNILKKHNLYKQLRTELFYHATKPGYRFYKNIEPKYKHEFFKKWQAFTRELKHDKSFSFEYFNNEQEKFIKNVINGNYKATLKINDTPTNTFVENIFSIKNSLSKRHKIITMLGLKIKIKRKKKKHQKEILDEITKLYYLQKSNIQASQIHKKTFSNYKNIYAGKKIVMVACGPSAKYYTQKYCNSIHIGVNRAFFNDKVKLNFLFVQDNLEQDMKFANSYEKSFCTKFYGILPEYRYSQVKKEIIKISNQDICTANAKPYIIEDSVRNNWAQQLEVEPIGDWCGCVFSALQFALYTNPSTIYLIGCDCTDNGHFYKEKETNFKSKNIKNLSYQKKSWIEFFNFTNKYYPDTEIISVNPVGLKGMFRDVYTQSYVDEHPELLNEDIEILKDEELVSK